VSTPWWETLSSELGPTWDELKDAARRQLEAMSPLEVATMRHRQRIDFAYGNTKLSNPAITRDMVELACDLDDRVVRSDT
jgi:hypothetical protein